MKITKALKNSQYAVFRAYKYDGEHIIAIYRKNEEYVQFYRGNNGYYFRTESKKKYRLSKYKDWVVICNIPEHIPTMKQRFKYLVKQYEKHKYE